MQPRHTHRNMSRRQVSPQNPVAQPPSSASDLCLNPSHPHKSPPVSCLPSYHVVPLVAIFIYLFGSMYYAWSQTLPRAAQFSAPTSTSDLDMLDITNTSPANIAFFVHVSKRSIYLLPRLLRHIYHPENSYALHFDTDLDTVLVTHAIKSIRTDPNYESNIFFLPTDLTTPRGVSVLLNTIAAINLLDAKGRSWDYFINLAGTDYPLVSAQTQRQLLGLYPGLNFFNFMPGRSWQSLAIDRLSRIWYDESIAFHKKPVAGSLKPLNIHNPLIDDLNLKVCSADMSMILSREFSQYLLKADSARKLLIAMSYGMDSSRQFFATLAWNNVTFVDTIVPYPVRVSTTNDSGGLQNGAGVLIDAEDGDGHLKFWGVVKESHSFFAGRFERPDSSMMERLDRRANHSDVSSKMGKHFLRMIVSRESRRLEVEESSS